MNQLKRCMGNERSTAQCQNCARLPRTPEEEEAKDWIDPGFRDRCGKFKEIPK